MAKAFRYSMNDTAVLWSTDRGYDQNGRPTISSSEGEEIRCRWEDEGEITYVSTSESIKFDAVVFVDVDVPIGSLLWKGKLEDWPGVDIDVEDSRIMKVVEIEKIPDLKRRHYTRCLKLMRYTDTLAGTP